MNKQLKFSSELVPLILSGQKTTTWRVFDDKELKTGDIVDFIDRGNLKTFARARIIDVKKKSFSDLNDTDKTGHEPFSSDEEMYRTFSKYYDRPVGPETKVKIIKFTLIKSP